MDSNATRKNILTKIAAASKGRSVFVGTSHSTVEIYKPILPDLLDCFVRELELVNGKAIVCENNADLYLKLSDYLLSNKLVDVFCKQKYITNHLATNGISTTDAEDDFYAMQVGITECEFLIARTGSVMVSSASDSGRRMNVFPPIHIVIAQEAQLVALPEEALVALMQKYDSVLPSVITTITGPSRTADIEKTLVLGAHGPKEFIVFISKV